MTIFIASVATVVLVSCFCSLSEASIYAVRRPWVRGLVDQGSMAGRVLESFKSDMDKPISAILIVNTAANTAGASIAGAEARALFGPDAVIWFSVFFTLAVLFLAEILPKVIGVMYPRPVARAVAIPWQFAIRLMNPVIWTVTKVTERLKPGTPAMAAPEEEVVQMARLSAEEGSILPIEARLVRNVLLLDDVTVEDMMTPRTVVFMLPETLTMREVADTVRTWHHSRIPIHTEDEPENWTGFVRTQDVLSAIAMDRFNVRLSELARPIPFVTLGMHGHELLTELIERRTHIAGVVDPLGGVAGVVTLEDVIESLIGEEIVDEVDRVADMQEFARQRHRRRSKRREMDAAERDASGEPADPDKTVGPDNPDEG